MLYNDRNVTLEYAVYILYKSEQYKERPEYDMMCIQYYTYAQIFNNSHKKYTLENILLTIIKI